MKYISLTLFFYLINLIYAAEVLNPIFWERSFSMNISKPHAFGSLNRSTSSMVTCQDFQGVNVYSDLSYTTERVIFNFGDCCLSSNTTFEKIQALNHDSIEVSAIQYAQKLALVKRGNCSWSEKVSVVNNIALLNNINVSAVFIYDDNYYDVDIKYIPVTGTGVLNPPQYSTPLPANRSILNMPDNDISNTTLPMNVYFIPNAYGETFVDRLNHIYDPSNPSMRYYWLVTPYFDQVSWGYASSGNFFATGKGYLAYIIALSSIFIIAVVFLRWWRVRHLRAEPLNGFNDGFHMQPRTNHLDPLPVDIVNGLPIELYSEELIKNVNCAICIEDFIPNKSDIRILPCGHGFCVLCIDPWLTQKSTMCPICKWDCLPADLRRERDLQQQNNQFGQPQNHIPGPSSMINQRQLNPENTMVPTTQITSAVIPVTASSSSSSLNDDIKIPMPDNEIHNLLHTSSINESASTSFINNESSSNVNIDKSKSSPTICEASTSSSDNESNAPSLSDNENNASSPFVTIDITSNDVNEDKDGKKETS